MNSADDNKVASDATDIGFEEDAASALSKKSVATGPDVIKDYLPRLPARPGAYRLLRTKGDGLYVG